MRYLDVLEPWSLLARSLPQREGFDVTNIFEEGCPFSARLIILSSDVWFKCSRREPLSCSQGLLFVKKPKHLGRSS